MDGYTFMIERNRLLILHEASQADVRTRVEPVDAAAWAELRKTVLGLYGSLEGCGRVHAPGQTHPK